MQGQLMLGQFYKDTLVWVLSLRMPSTWLYSISPKKVKRDMRDKIIRFREECDDVLLNWSKITAAQTVAFAGALMSAGIASGHRTALGLGLGYVKISLIERTNRALGIDQESESDLRSGSCRDIEEP